MLPSSMRIAIAFLITAASCTSTPHVAIDPALRLRDAVLASLPTTPYTATITTAAVQGLPPTTSTITADPARARMLVVQRLLPDIMTVTARYDGTRVVMVTERGGQMETLAAPQRAVSDVPFAWGLHLAGALAAGTDWVGTLRFMLLSGMPRLGTTPRTLIITTDAAHMFDAMVADHSPNLESLAQADSDMMNAIIRSFRDASSIEVVVDDQDHVRSVRMASYTMEVGPLLKGSGPSDDQLTTPAEQLRTVIDMGPKLQQSRAVVDALINDPARLAQVRTAFIEAWAQR